MLHAAHPDVCILEPFSPSLPGEFAAISQHQRRGCGDPEGPDLIPTNAIFP